VVGVRGRAYPFCLPLSKKASTQRTNMNREQEVILDMYKFRLIHYCKKGMGAYSDLSVNTKITPKLVKNTLERYIELGGSEDFSDFTEEKYRDFLVEFI
tara:strand:- start:217 stop:513 length:297 start_codon:yes stop_codon:yes gene_type:complete